MKPVVFLDVDGIVADLHPCLYQAHGRTYDPINGEKGRAAWDLEKVFDVSWEGLWEKVEYDMIRHIPKTREADKIVRLVSPPNRLWDIVFLTSPVPVHLDARHQWLKEHFPSIPRVYTPLKYLCCKGPQTLLIDDFDDNCDRWEKEGGSVIRFPRYWNSLWEQETGYFPDKFISRFKDWVGCNVASYLKTYEEYCDALQDQP